MDLNNLSTTVINVQPKMVTYHLVSLDEVIIVGLFFVAFLVAMWYLQKHPEKRFTTNKKGKTIDLYKVARGGFYLFVVAVIITAIAQYALFGGNFVQVCDAVTGVCQ